MEMRPIAHIKTDLPQKFGIPRNSFLAPHLQGRIVFEPESRSRRRLMGWRSSAICGCCGSSRTACPAERPPT